MSFALFEKIPKLKKVLETLMSMVLSFALFEKMHTQDEAENFGFNSAFKENVS